MSDQSQGEGWWQASDDKWYPPPRPDASATTPNEPPTEPVTQPFTSPSGPPPGATQYGPPPGAPIGEPTSPPEKSGIGRGPIIGIAAAVLVIVVAIAFFATRDNGTSQNVSANQTEQSGSGDGSTASSSSHSTSSSSSHSGSNQSSSIASSSVTIPSGFKNLTNESEGVSIAVPNDFKQIDSSTFLNSSDESTFSGQNPDLAPFLSSGNSFLQGSVVAAAGTTNGKPTVVVVGKSPEQIDPNDAATIRQLKSELESDGASNISIAKKKLPAGDALRVALTVDVNGSNTTGTVNEVLYFVNVGHTTWVMVGASVGSDAGGLLDQVAKTLAIAS